jgi:hypothetical protein
MRESLLSMEYFETYYYANIVHNVLDDTMDYLRNLNNWHEDREVDLFLQPFPKWSVLHDLSHFIIAELMYERLDDVTLDSIVNNRKYELWVDQALRHHGFRTDGFRHWMQVNARSLDEITEDDIYEYHHDLGETGELDALLTQLSNEVFFLLFGNRALLARLNNYVAAAVRDISKDELEPDLAGLMERDGVPARAHIPEWVRRAVFFRDRGMCAACNTDLSGLVTVHNDKHFDHIIPLAEGGINDVTNIQLLCGTCNLTKGKKVVGTSNRYEAWYT